MDSIKRGKVFLVNFDPTVESETKKTRPAAVVSNDLNNAYSPKISIAPISSKITRIYSCELEASFRHLKVVLPLGILAPLSSLSDVT
jgi:mRNA-degrading endonuclease toxin of MazEF toxin-antitoxin module